MSENTGEISAELEEMSAENVLSDEMQYQDPQSWGDTSEDDTGASPEFAESMQTMEMFTTEDEDNENPILAELQNLVSFSGIRLIRCHNTWNVNNYAAKLR